MFKKPRSWSPGSDADDPVELHAGIENAKWAANHRFSVTDEELTQCFPFSPYPNQMRFMRELYSCASKGGYGFSCYSVLLQC